MYHSISRQSGHLYVAPELFEEHCRVLARAGWRGVSLAEAEAHLLHGKKLPRRSCLFTFDDGYLDNYVHAEPILRAHGHHGVIFPVLNLLEEREEPRPNRDDLIRNPERAAELGDLDTETVGSRSGLPVRVIRFCSWSEIRRMHEGGVMAVAPHSLDHGRVVAGPRFKEPKSSWKPQGFFSVPPHDMIRGMPRFPLGHSLSARAWTLSPDIRAVVQRMVPQGKREAWSFLKSGANRAALRRALEALPCIGVPESEAAFRERVFAELRACRELFEQRLGVTPVSFCWPWGSFGRESLEEAQRAGFRLTFGTDKMADVPEGSVVAYRFGVRPVSSSRLLWMARVFSSSLFARSYFRLADWSRSKDDGRG